MFNTTEVAEGAGEMKRAVVSFRMLAVGVLGGALGVVLCRWGGCYLPETDSFVGLRDLPAILLALLREGVDG